MHTAGKANIRGRIDGCKEALSDLVSQGHSSRIVTSGVDFCIGLCCDLRFSHLLSMLFKTLSASVYGIDAYLVEVEVDVGSARMTDFNVGGVSLSRRSGAISWKSPVALWPFEKLRSPEQDLRRGLGSERI
jgi:hypothetical protein